MDQFVLYDTAAKGLTMGYYHTSSLDLPARAAKYTLCDHFFHGVYGGSLQNHIFLISANVDNFAAAPASIKRAVLDASGMPVPDANGKPQDGPLTPDGYVVGTLYPAATHRCCPERAELGGLRNYHDLRRKRRLRGSREPSRRGSVGTWDAGADICRLPLRKEGVCRYDRLRHLFDLGAHRAPLGP
jgi:hypothetical protein